MRGNYGAFSGLRLESLASIKTRTGAIMARSFFRFISSIFGASDARQEGKAEANRANTGGLIRAEWPHDYQFLFIEPPANEVAEALDGWKWIGLDGLEPAAVSAFGDIFFRAGDGSVRHLDMLDGKLTRIAGHWAEFQADLQNEARRDELLLAGLVVAARKNGLIPAAGQCYDFKKPPVLGGEMSLREMETTFFVVKVHIAGQIHRQVKDLPQGAKINKVTISDR
jgi:hypothetical protein